MFQLTADGLANLKSQFATSSSELFLKRPAGRIAVHHLQHQDWRSKLPQHLPLAERNLPTHLHIAEAPAEYIARPIVSGGLSNQKAKAIRDLLDVIVEKFGEPTLKPLRKLSDDAAEAFLLSLPGVGKRLRAAF